MIPRWKPMPYYWIRDNGGFLKFKRNNLSESISAMKIYIVFCLMSNQNEDGDYCVSLTYDQLTKLASISRKLVRDGLKHLSDNELIRSHGVKNKKYFLQGIRRIKREKARDSIVKCDFSSTQGYWTKLPYKGIVDDSGRIPAFEAMTNRSYLELNSLKIFMYLLSIRNRKESIISVTLSTINSKLNIQHQDILTAIAYMQSVGLIYKVDLKGASIHNYNEGSSIHFLVCGWNYLEWTPEYRDKKRVDSDMLYETFNEF